MHRMDGCAVLCNLERRRGLADSCFWASEPGVARRLLTFLASPRKVSKRRRPQVRRPSGSLRCSQTRAAAELGLVEELTPAVWFVLALRQSSRKAPAFAPLLSSSHGALVSLRRPRHECARYRSHWEPNSFRSKTDASVVIRGTGKIATGPDESR